MDAKVLPINCASRDASMAFLQACIHGHPPGETPPDHPCEPEATEQAGAERIARAFCDMPQHRLSAVMRGFADLAATDLNRSR